MTRTDARRTLIRPDLADIAMKGTVAAERYVAPEPAEIIAARAPLLSSPDAAGMAAELLRGDRVRVAERRGGMAWLQRDRDGYVGWAAEEALRLGADAPSAEGDALVTAPLTHLYPAPDIKTLPRAVLSMGARLARTGPEADGFVPVEGGHLRVQALAPLPEDPASIAEMLLGAPYLWGGESPMGIDCSGLVQLASAMAGRPAPRDSDMQAAELGTALENPWEDGRAIAAAPAFRRGDLVFWRGHVGMMLDATRLIHANAFHMRVAVEPLAEAVARISASSGGAGRGAGLPVALRRP